ncbi:hypothetical protein [Flavobacterium soyangense]|uniref:hypothetical protein n=1 Tax=Flavobacterium soyangense TaxID=2023265 RepID=UPI001E65BFB1|nr:hypothetical protein [Flavobacterium soyangense]
MKQFFLLIFIIGFASKSFGQSEFNTKFKAIPPLNTKPKPKKETLPPPTDLPKIVSPNVFKNTNILNTKPKTDNSFEIGTAENHFSMTPTNKFVNPGDLVANRLNKKADNEDQIVYRRNQDLGSFKTKSLTARVTYRDYGEVDGDEIRVLLNDKAIVTGIILDSKFQGFEITLLDGFNKIDFEALNQGRLGPNTAEFQVYDDKGTLISASQWNLGTGFKATIIITKEK